MSKSPNLGEKETKNDTISDDNDDPNYRIISVLSYFLVLIVMGLPIWWFTTRVYRANLPIDEINDLKLEIEAVTKEHRLPLSLEYDILISIVHPDPGNLDINLEGEQIETGLQPLINKLSSIAKFVVKSQWLFLTDLGVTTKKMGDYYVLEESELAHVITPLETKLWSNISPRPVINLVIYFPPCSMPLHILDKERNPLESNAFLSPLWGGILIVNPDDVACNSSNFQPDLQAIVSVFGTQIKHLFKIENLTNSQSIRELKIRKANELLLSTHRTLKSLAKLLVEISSIVISDDVGEKISQAVENAKSAESELKSGQIDAGLENAKVAFEKSEAAFSDPSLLALLYFPEDQKYAVYIPLFLPIMIPVIMSLALVKKWKKETKVKEE